MRFGQDFHRYMVPEWTSLYVPYDSVKNAFNLVVGKSIDAKVEPDFSEVYALLDGSIRCFDKFYLENSNFLMARQAKLEMNYGIIFKAIVLSKEEEDNFDEAKRFLKVVTKIHDDFEKLQNYSRLNEEGIQRLFAKIEKLGDCKGLLHQEQKSRWKKSQLDRHTQCAKFIDQAEVLISHFTEASPDRDGPSTIKALLSELDSGKHPLLVAQYSALYRAIRKDDPSALAVPLNRFLRDPPAWEEPTAFLYKLAELAATCYSQLCFRYLLSEKFNISGVVLEHDLLNHIIIMEGQQLSLSQPRDDLKDNVRPGEKEQLSLFNFAIVCLDSRKQGILSAKDTFGRTSLHYAALHGVDFICQLIVDYSHVWGLGFSSSLILTSDCQGFTPFHYAIIENHVDVAKVFLETLISEISSGQAAQTQSILKILNHVLSLAIRYMHDDIVFLFAKSSFDFHESSLNGESALYVAAQIGRNDYVNALLQHSKRVYIDTAEKVHGWTPLFIACVEGHLTIAKLLLQAGANQDLYDHHGWTAKEHAALRGHLHVAEILKSWDTHYLTGGPANMPRKSKFAAASHLSMNENHVIVNLGVLRNGKHVKPVNFKGCSAKHLASMDMSISVDSTSWRVKLPILSDMTNEPIVLPVANPSEASLSFKFYTTESSGEPRRLIGSAAYLLESDKDCFGANRESLIRERSLPILEKDTMNVMGTITFTFVVAKPLMGSNSPPLAKQHFSTERLQLVGHRGISSIEPGLYAARLSIADVKKGLGQNTANHNQLQLGENTIESFLSAARLGASYVEFDVQLTRDLVPIIYHDFSLSECGTDIPIHDLSFEQFMYASELQLPRGEPVSVLRGPNTQGQDRLRSRSLTKDQEPETVRIRERMKHTVDFMNKGFKPNTRGHSIQDFFTTMDDLLTKLPDSIGFNIEIKYPRLHEAVEAGIGPLGIEINTFIDRILARLFRVSSGRSIILSSFSPEICILLATKQDTYPVLFITNAGKRPLSDMEMRASSLQAAVRFSKRWNLAGVVFASETLILCPRLVGYVKRSGLICGSYGSLNNIPENAEVQQAAGLEILMVDNVRLIASTLDDSST